MEKRRWVRMDVDLYEHPKIRSIRLLPRGKEMVLCWMLMILLAGRCERDGALMIHDTLPHDYRSLAAFFDVDPEQMREYLHTFHNFSMIEIRDGVICLCGFAERHPALPDKPSAPRTLSPRSPRRHRNGQEKEKAEQKEKEEQEQEQEQEQIQEQIREQHTRSLTLSREEKEREARHALGGKLGRGLVLLSEEQMEDLLERLSLEEFNKYVSIVADCEAKGKHYRSKTHYTAILEMAGKDRGRL